MLEKEKTGIEKNEEDNINKKKKSSSNNSSYTEYFPSKNIYFYNILCLIASFIFFLNNYQNFVVIIFVIISNIVFFFITKLNYNTYRLFLSKKNIYIKNNYTKNKIKLNLIDDVSFIKVNSNLLGKILNFGTIELITSNNEKYVIPSIQNANAFQEQVLINTKKYYKHLGIDYNELVKSYELIEKLDKDLEEKEKEEELKNKIKNK